MVAPNRPWWWVWWYIIMLPSYTVLAFTPSSLLPTTQFTKPRAYAWDPQARRAGSSSSSSITRLQALPFSGDNVLPSLLLLLPTAAAIPLSVPVDQALQGGYERIDSIANTVIDDGEGEGVRAYVSRPAAEGPRPVIFLIHQFFGLRPRDTALCDELARLGYVAIAPDCFQGQTTGVIPRAIWQVRKAAFNDDWEINLRDFDRVVRWVEKQPWADSSRMATSGFCFGGGLALRYGDLHPEKVKAVVVFYGRPLKELQGLKSPVYGVFGTRDRQFPPAMVEAFQDLLGKKGITHEIRNYEGRTHAFVKDLEDIQAGGDSGDAWNGMLEFLRVHLA